MRARCAVAALVFAVLAGGCGYRLAGRAHVDVGSSRGLWIGPVEDEGDEPLFGAKLGRALASETVDRAEAVVALRDQAHAFLTVRVDAVDDSAAAYSAVSAVREYLLKAEATVTLTRPGGAVIWRGRGVRAQREYPAGRDVNETENNKEKAVVLLARDLAREVLRRVSLALAETGS